MPKIPDIPVGQGSSFPVTSAGSGIAAANFARATTGALSAAIQYVEGARNEQRKLFFNKQQTEFTRFVNDEKLKIDNEEGDDYDTRQDRFTSIVEAEAARRSAQIGNDDLLRGELEATFATIMESRRVSVGEKAHRDLVDAARGQAEVTMNEAVNLAIDADNVAELQAAMDMGLGAVDNSLAFRPDEQAEMSRNFIQLVQSNRVLDVLRSAGETPSMGTARGLIAEARRRLTEETGDLLPRQREKIDDEINAQEAQIIGRLGRGAAARLNRGINAAETLEELSQLSDVNRRLFNGLIVTEAAHISFDDQIHARAQKIINRDTGSFVVERHLASGEAIDSVANAKELGDFYEKHIEIPALRGEIDAEEVERRIDGLVAIKGYAPQMIKKFMNMANEDDPALVISAATRYRKALEDAPLAMRAVNNDVEGLLLSMDIGNRAGVDPHVLLAGLKKQLSLSQEERAVINDKYDMAVENTGLSDAEWLQKQVGGPVGIVELAAFTRFNQSMFYLNPGEVEKTREIALQSSQRVFGETSYGADMGSRQSNPVELYYPRVLPEEGQDQLVNDFAKDEMVVLTPEGEIPLTKIMRDLPDRPVKRAFALDTGNLTKARSKIAERRSLDLPPFTQEEIVEITNEAQRQNMGRYLRLEYDGFSTEQFDPQTGAPAPTYGVALQINDFAPLTVYKKVRLPDGTVRLDPARWAPSEEGTAFQANIERERARNEQVRRLEQFDALTDEPWFDPNVNPQVGDFPEIF